MFGDEDLVLVDAKLDCLVLSLWFADSEGNPWWAIVIASFNFPYGLVSAGSEEELLLIPAPFVVLERVLSRNLPVTLYSAS